VTNGIRLPFALSLIGHAVLLGLLALFVRRPPPAPKAPLMPSPANQTERCCGTAIGGVVS
jgi:hypothetical protein